MHELTPDFFPSSMKLLKATSSETMGFDLEAPAFTHASKHASRTYLCVDALCLQCTVPAAYCACRASYKKHICSSLLCCPSIVPQVNWITPIRNSGGHSGARAVDSLGLSMNLKQYWACNFCIQSCVCVSQVGMHHHSVVPLME